MPADGGEMRAGSSAGLSAEARLRAVLAGAKKVLVERSGFREYFDALDGTGYGSDGFSWTAALVLDLIERHRGPARARLLERLRDG